MTAEPGTFRGVRGFVKVAYATAAEVAPFLITFNKETKAATLTGPVLAPHAYLLTLTPLVFVVPTKAGAMRWPIETWTIGATGHVVATLGPFLED